MGAGLEPRLREAGTLIQDVLGEPLPGPGSAVDTEQSYVSDGCTAKEPSLLPWGRGREEPLGDCDI